MKEMGDEKIEVKKDDVKKEVVKEASSEDFFAVRNKVPVERIVVKGIGAIYIHGLTGVQRVQWLEEASKDDGTMDPHKYLPAMVSLCVRNKDGKRLFGKDDIRKIMELPSGIIVAITDVCSELSGIGSKADKVILRNFGKAPDEDS